jgi:hypothetical protein
MSRDDEARAPQEAGEDTAGRQPTAEPADTPRAAPAGSVPDAPAEGVDPMPEVPGGPQVDVPAAQGNLDASGDADRG